MSKWPAVTGNTGEGTDLQAQEFVLSYKWRLWALKGKGMPDLLQGAGLGVMAVFGLAGIWVSLLGYLQPWWSQAGQILDSGISERKSTDLPPAA